MDSLVLRFVQENDSYEFATDTDNYPRQITNAFYAFKEESGHDNAQLELFHEAHGWQLVCLGHGYPTIRKPETLDFGLLVAAIWETRVMMERWPEPTRKAIDIQPPRPRRPSRRRKRHLRLVK